MENQLEKFYDFWNSRNSIDTWDNVMYYGNYISFAKHIIIYFATLLSSRESRFTIAAKVNKFANFCNLLCIDWETITRASSPWMFDSALWHVRELVKTYGRVICTIMKRICGYEGSNYLARIVHCFASKKRWEREINWVENFSRDMIMSS